MNNLNLENENNEEQKQSTNTEIMLGSIISKVKIGNDDIVRIQRRIDEIELKKQSYVN